MTLLLPLLLLAAPPSDTPDAAYERGDFKACAALYEQALARKKYPSGVDAYNPACCHAKAGAKAQAFKLLRRSVTLGLKDAAMLEADEDLASLHGEKDWAPLVASVKQAKADWLGSINAELLKLYEEDQADRQGAMPPDVMARDAGRRKAVDAILAAGGAHVADDYFHAAMVFQHGDGEADIARANELAKKAVALSKTHARARWLVAASEDRLLMRQHKPQKYGTQYALEGGAWVLYQVDPKVTDAQRAEWGVPTLAEAKAHVAEIAARMNAAAPPAK